MDDFFKDLFSAVGNNVPELLADYDDEDLSNFFADHQIVDAKTRLKDLAAAALEHLDSETRIRDLAAKCELSIKSIDKLLAYVRNNKSDLQEMRIVKNLRGEDRLDRFSWSVRSVFFSKKDEFKGQKKYGVLDFDIVNGSKQEKVKLNCSREAILAIRSKLALLDDNIRQLFEDN